MHELIKFVEQSQIRTDLPELEIGDLIKVYLKVKEGQRERLQLFEGYLIARQGGGGKVRRAKLYYLRDRMGKAARIKER